MHVGYWQCCNTVNYSIVGQPSTTPNALPGANPYSIPGGPGSVPANPANIPITQNTGSTLQGPPSNAPLSQGPPSNAPPSPRGPLSNTPASNQSNSAANNLSAELSADFPDIVNSSSGGDNVSALLCLPAAAFIGLACNLRIENGDQLFVCSPLKRWTIKIY